MERKAVSQFASRPFSVPQLSIQMGFQHRFCDLYSLKKQRVDVLANV